MSALRACREGQELLHPWSLVGQSVLELDAHNVQQLLAYILQRVRAQRLCPDCCGRCAASGLSRIRKDPTVRITPHEIGPAGISHLPIAKSQFYRILAQSQN